MRITQAAAWAWGLSLIVLIMLVHVLGLVLISRKAIHARSHMIHELHRTTGPVMVMGYTVLLIAVLHGMEAVMWAGAYLLLGALTDFGSAVLYSLSAITSYGHANLYLERQWQLLGALEALNGCLLFGLTTAFLFAVIQKVLLSTSDERQSSANRS